MGNLRPFKRRLDKDAVDRARRAAREQEAKWKPNRKEKQ